MEQTKKIAEYIAGAGYADIPPSTLQRAKSAILDHVGVTLAGSRESASRIAAELAQEEGSREQAAVFGHGFRSSSMTAAFVNGVSGHALDFDASFTIMGQPMSGLVAAVFAVSEAMHLGGKQLLEAYVVGYELIAKLAWFMPSHAEEGGWHAAGTLGSLGCAAASCSLLELDAEKTCMALGIAGSLASGVFQNYGTMGKPLHAGLAARNGVHAALLARKGFTASPAMLDAPGGFFESFARGMSLHPQALERLGRPYELEKGGVTIKPYPCGGLAHQAIDAVLALRREHALAAASIDRIDVGVTPFTAKRIVYRIPQTELQGKFSMAYVLARAVIDGGVTLDSFTESAIRDSAVLALAERVHMAVDPELTGLAPGIFPCKVSIRLTGGQTLVRRVDHPRGTPEAPLTPEELREKFTACARRALNDAAMREAAGMLENIENLKSIAPLSGILAGTGR